MSIIIRLQNLPWTANSADIRHFFGGLNIPEGGVHIIGGEDGDAFIAFSTDEDARLAMLKSETRLQGNRVRLHLSSRPELEQLLEDVRAARSTESTKSNGQSSKRHISPSRSSQQSHLLSSGGQSRSPSRRRDSGRHVSRDEQPRSRHRSPQHKRDDKEIQRGHGQHYVKSSQEAITQPEVRFISSSELYDRRTPDKSFTAPKQPNTDDIFAKFIASNFSQPQELPFSRPALNPQKRQFPSEFQMMESPEGFPKELKVFRLDSDTFDSSPFRRFGELPSDRHLSGAEWSASADPAGYNQSDVEMMRPFHQASGFYDRGDRNPMPDSPFDLLPNYCVQLTGLTTNSSYKDIQTVLRGIYAPQHNIRWDVNSRGGKTGTVYVKLSSQEDHEAVLHKSGYSLKDKSVSVSQCPEGVFHNLFKSRSRRQDFDDKSSSDFVYMLKGLPYATTEEDIVCFFTPLDVVDLLILYDCNGKATGTGYVQFSSLDQYRTAFERNGKKIGYRYIELVRSTREDMDDARNTAVGVSKPIQDILNEQMFKNRMQMYRQNMAQKRPLCAILSGLPSSTTCEDIFSFFSACSICPDAVHSMWNVRMDACNGRAYVEFLDSFDLDIALKQNGQFMGQNMITVKQILFDEMLNIVESNVMKNEFAAVRKRTESKDKSGPIPEKLPYIWDPPDMDDEELPRQGAQHTLSSKCSSNGGMGGHRMETSNMTAWPKPKPFESKLQQSTSMPTNRSEYPRRNNDTRPDNRKQFQRKNNARFRGNNHLPSSSNQFDADTYNRGMHQATSFAEQRSTANAFVPDKRLERNSIHIPQKSVDLFSKKGNKPPLENNSTQVISTLQVVVNRNTQFPTHEKTGKKKFSPKNLRCIQRSEIPPAAHKEPETLDVSRLPIKFGVKTHQPSVPTSEKLKDAFDPESKETQKIVLNKLSPELEAKQQSDAKKSALDPNDMKLTKQCASVKKKSQSPPHVQEDTDVIFMKTVPARAYQSGKKKTPSGKDATMKKSSTAAKQENKMSRKDDDKRRDRQSDKRSSPARSSKGRRDFGSRSRDTGRQYQHGGQKFQNRRGRSEGYLHRPQNSRGPWIDTAMQEPAIGRCMIHAAGVPHSVRLEDILDFFRGFRINQKDVIRRYMEDGQPTEDVRIAFENPKEAERAVQRCNHRYLAGVPVTLFLI